MKILTYEDWEITFQNDTVFKSDKKLREHEKYFRLQTFSNKYIFSASLILTIKKGPSNA